MPVKFFMKSSNLITFHLDDYTDSIKDVMAKKRHRDFPILDKNDRYVGMVSRRNLLGIKRRQLILVDHNEKSQAVDNIESADILEIIDHHRGLLGDHGSGLFPEPACGLHGHDPLSDLPGAEAGDPEKYRRPSLRGHHFRYVDVPLTHLYGSGPGSSGAPG